MIIEDIQKRRKSLAAILLDNGEEVLIDFDVCFINKLKAGMQIESDDLQELIYQSDLKRSKERALWYLSMRDYSRSELFFKLKRDFDENACIEALDRLEELNLLDDERFARRYATELYGVKKLSKRAVVYKLREKGIDSDTALSVAEELEPEIEELVDSLINTKYYNSMFDEKGRKRTHNALLRAGYSYGDIKEAFLRFDEENEGISDFEDEFYE